MLLKSLELQGFKTFPDKTTLSFGHGITAVVGPNGSGKSNISDAVRWVLGEQSTRVLRCSRMEDVIFNGTPIRKAQGYAEITLTIDNSLHQLPFKNDTVAVTRRFYRSGDSEYLLNKATVRLKDVHELFMDTGLGRDGYSIIGQGKIDSIVAARSEDRREIFEEAAGISRFRYRKEESERRLNQAEENLVRLRDILSELECRVGPLKEQAEKAEQYLEFAGEKRVLEIGLWLNTLNRSGLVLREHNDKIIIAQNQHEDSEKEIDKIGVLIEQNFTKSNGLTACMDEIRQEAARQEETATRKDGEVSVLQNDILHHTQNIERLTNEIAQSSLSGQDMEREIAEKTLEIEKKQQEIGIGNHDFSRLTIELEELRRGMDETSAKVDSYTQNIVRMNANLSELKVQEMTAYSSISEINIRLSALSSATEERDQRMTELNSSGQDYAAMLRDTEGKINSLTNSVKGYEMRLETRKQRVDTMKKQQDQLNLDVQEQVRRARLLEDLERNLEGFAQSVKMVMKEFSRGTLSGIHGPVSRLFHVPQQYAVAIETALGAAMQNIVVESEQDAKRAISLLKQRDGGRATFLPLSTIKGNLLHENGLDGCPGFVGVASVLCKCEERYTGVLNSLLGRIAIAEDLDSAVAIARRFSYRFRIVTLDGQVVNTGGSLTGGSLNRNSGLLSRASDIEKIKETVEVLKKKAEQSSMLLKTAMEDLASAEAELMGAKGELTTYQEDRLCIDSEYKRVTVELETLERSSQQLEEEKKAALLRLETLTVTQKNAQENAQSMVIQIGEIQQKLDEISGNRGELNQKCEKLSTQLQEIRFTVLTAQKDEEALYNAVKEIERRKEDHKDHTEILKRECDSLETANAMLLVQIDYLTEQANTLRESAKTSKEKIEKISAQRMDLEKSSSELRSIERDKAAEREKIGHELARLEERKSSLQKEYDEIVKKLWEEYELTRREAEEACSPVENVQEAQKRLNELKAKIKALGSVNVAAVEEYKEVSERYEFMNSQIRDIEKSRDDLKKLIGELTHQMQDLFLERFVQINQNFMQTFRELFGGGTAGLAISNQEDILNCGIEISVQPPGKIVTHLELLSGGEKALVAIALYFAIMKVNPPPFCVLDEIEAALDDVNVNRFAAYLRRMNKNTQFIVITHRRGTMEEADVLYGVTMQDEGISKLLELHAGEIEKKLGIKQLK